VGGGRQTDDDEPGVGITEPRDRTAPVVLVSERRTPFSGDQLTPLHEPRAGATGHDIVVQVVELPLTVGTHDIER
jgi:hypothetical protein